MSTFRVTTTVRLSGIGQFGAALFIASPVMSAILLSIMGQYNGHTYSNSTDIRGLSMLIAICSFAFIIGAVMLFIGREYTHEIEVEPGRKRED